MVHWLRTANNKEYAIVLSSAFFAYHASVYARARIVSSFVSAAVAVA
jgi:hypothetical protein